MEFEAKQFQGNIPPKNCSSFLCGAWVRMLFLGRFTFARTWFFAANQSSGLFVVSGFRCRELGI